MNRAERRSKAKPKRGSGHIQLPINIRFAANHETQLMHVPMLSAEKMRDGTADESDWHALAHRLNWGLLLNKANFNEGVDPIDEALDILLDIKDRSPTQTEFSKIMDALGVCNDMQKMCTRRELRDSLELVYQKNEYLIKVEEIKDRLDSK